jgi:hypothetical protein
MSTHKRCRVESTVGRLTSLPGPLLAVILFDFLSEKDLVRLVRCQRQPWPVGILKHANRLRMRASTLANCCKHESLPERLTIAVDDPRKWMHVMESSSSPFWRDLELNVTNLARGPWELKSNTFASLRRLVLHLDQPQLGTSFLDVVVAPALAHAPQLEELRITGRYRFATAPRLAGPLRILELPIADENADSWTAMTASISTLEQLIVYGYRGCSILMEDFIHACTRLAQCTRLRQLVWPSPGWKHLRHACLLKLAACTEMEECRIGEFRSDKIDIMTDRLLVGAVETLWKAWPRLRVFFMRCKPSSAQWFAMAQHCPMLELCQFGWESEHDELPPRSDIEAFLDRHPQLTIFPPRGFSVRSSDHDWLIHQLAKRYGPRLTAMPGIQGCKDPVEVGNNWQSLLLVFQQLRSIHWLVPQLVVPTTPWACAGVLEHLILWTPTTSTLLITDTFLDWVARHCPHLSVFRLHARHGSERVQGEWTIAGLVSAMQQLPSLVVLIISNRVLPRPPHALQLFHEHRQRRPQLPERFLTPVMTIRFAYRDERDVVIPIVS